MTYQKTTNTSNQENKSKEITVVPDSKSKVNDKKSSIKEEKQTIKPGKEEEIPKKKMEDKSSNNQNPTGKEEENPRSQKEKTKKVQTPFVTSIPVSTRPYYKHEVESRADRMRRQVLTPFILLLITLGTFKSRFVCSSTSNS